MLSKVFSDRLNRELDIMGLSPQESERIRDFSKLCRINKSKAELFLHGTVPDIVSLQTIAQELEVNPDWLLGRSPQKQKKDEDEA